MIAMATDGAVKAGAHAGNLIKGIAALVGGGGGGRPNMAQAGGKNPAGIKGTILSLALIIIIVGVSYFYSAGHTVNIVDLQNNGFFGHGETVITETSILVTYVACVAAFVTAVATEIWGAFK